MSINALQSKYTEKYNGLVESQKVDIKELQSKYKKGIDVLQSKLDDYERPTFRPR